jgi:hypothetical protein
MSRTFEEYQRCFETFGFVLRETIPEDFSMMPIRAASSLKRYKYVSYAKDGWGNAFFANDVKDMFDGIDEQFKRFEK